MTNPLIHLRKPWQLAALLGVCTLTPALSARQQARADAPPEPPPAAPQERAGDDDKAQPEDGERQPGFRARRPGADLRSRSIRRRPHVFDFNGPPNQEADKNENTGPWGGQVPEWRRGPNFGGRNRAPQGFGNGPQGFGGPQGFRGGPQGFGGGPQGFGGGPQGFRGPQGPGGPGGMDDQEDERRAPEGFGEGNQDGGFGGRRGPGAFGQGGVGPGGRFGGQMPGRFSNGLGQFGEQGQFDGQGKFGGRGARGPRGFGDGMDGFQGRGPRFGQRNEATPGTEEQRENPVQQLPEPPVVSSGPKIVTGTVSSARGDGFSLKSGQNTLRVTFSGKLPAGLSEGTQVQLYGIQTGDTFLATNVRVLARH